MIDNYLLSVGRAFFYLWMAVEFFDIANLYFFGYYRLKKTPIIGALVGIFFSIGVFFSSLIVIAITGAIDIKRYQDIVNWLFLLFIPILFFVRKFHNESLRVEDKKEIEKTVKK